MANYYADTSVLVKRHIKEIGAAWVKSLMSAQVNNTFFTAQISEVELYSALNRRLREKAISPLRYARLKIVFHHLWSLHYVILALTDPVIAFVGDEFFCSNANCNANCLWRSLACNYVKSGFRLSPTSPIAWDFRHARSPRDFPYAHFPNRMGLSFRLSPMVYQSSGELPK